MGAVVAGPFEGSRTDGTLPDPAPRQAENVIRTPSGNGMAVTHTARPPLVLRQPAPRLCRWLAVVNCAVHTPPEEIERFGKTFDGDASQTEQDPAETALALVDVALEPRRRYPAPPVPGKTAVTRIGAVVTGPVPRIRPFAGPVSGRRGHQPPGDQLSRTFRKRRSRSSCSPALRPEKNRASCAATAAIASAHSF